MTEKLRHEQILPTERRVLQALCQGTRQGSLRAAGKRLLGDYRWHEPLHQVLFELLSGFPSDDVGLLRDELPSRLTRRGFPDVAWEEFFEPHALSKKQAERLVRQLRDSSSRGRG
jgi:hypothetical protein